MSCGVGHRHGLELVLLWLWCRLGAAALVQSLAWELPHATDAALKSQKEEKERKRRRGRRRRGGGQEARLVTAFLACWHPSFPLHTCHLTGPLTPLGA